MKTSFQEFIPLQIATGYLHPLQHTVNESAKPVNTSIITGESPGANTDKGTCVIPLKSR